MSKRCLINVDLQHDFITGSLALKNAPAGHDAEALIPCINFLSQCADFDLVVYSLDYHPPNHISFVDNFSLYTSIPEPLRVGDHMLTWTADGYVRQQLWPKHCVWHTEGARLWPTLFRPLSALYVYKGTVADIESYSVFGNDERHYDTGLHALLQGFDVGHIYFTGIAEDICVAHSALDALRLGYAVTVIEDATCGASDSEGIVTRMSGILTLDEAMRADLMTIPSLNPQHLELGTLDAKAAPRYYQPIRYHGQTLRLQTPAVYMPALIYDYYTSGEAVLVQTTPWLRQQLDIVDAFVRETAVIPEALKSETRQPYKPIQQGKHIYVIVDDACTMTTESNIPMGPGFYSFAIEFMHVYYGFHYYDYQCSVNYRIKHIHFQPEA